MNDLMQTRLETTLDFQSWLRQWVASTTGLDEAEVSEDAPLQSFGLSSRDVVVLSGELENLTGLILDATVAYSYPTIRALAGFLASGGNSNAEVSTSNMRGDDAAASSSLSAQSRPLSPAEHDVAIVGLAVRLPGADTPEAMWDTVVAGDVHVSDPPKGRWEEYAGDEVTTHRLNQVPTKGGYIEDVASFDAEFFGLSPLEAANMDPQQRIMLELTWEALEDAGIPANELKGSRTGVYVGSSNNDYGLLVSADPSEMHPYALTGTASSIIPNRISYCFDFRGPSINVDTACSSSLVALHQAVRDVRAGDAEVAIAGGINVLAAPFVSIAFGELGVISEEGIKAFSDDAKGIVRSDGAGLVVLKRVADAVRDGDEIYAVIAGSAVNSDGRSNGLTAPNPDAQVDVLRRAYRDAGIDPASVDYVEAHGTGTILGDPIEAGALGTVLGRGREAANPLLVGSAKTNFGHTESAAGVTGVIKVALSMRNDTIPPLAGFSEPNRYIDFDASCVEPVEDPREWPEYSGHKVAGVSGFGFGGTNAHVVMTEWMPEKYGAAVDTQRAALLNDADAVVLEVSGLIPSRRRLAAGALAEWIDQNRAVPLIDVARSTALHNHGRSRAVVIAADHDEAVKRLRLVADGSAAAGIRSADSPSEQGPVFVYSGFGSQHRKMAKELFELAPYFAQRLTELDAIVQYESGWSVCEIVQDDALTYDTETAQVAITAVQIALTDYLREMGATPAAVVGMSMGEIAAAYAAGGLTAEDAMTVACHRSRLMGEGERSLSEDQLGAMALVELASDDLPEDIEPAVYAAPGMTTVGGPHEKVTALVDELSQKGAFARLLNVKGAGHTSALDPILGELWAEVSPVIARPLTVPLFSSVDRGVIYPAGSIVHDADYWVRCTRQPVWFQDAVEQAFGQGHSTFVEVSPNPVALMPLMGTAFAVGRSDAQLLPTLKRKVPSAQTLRDVAAQLYVIGHPIRFDRLCGPGPRAAIPGVTWKKQHYWTAARPASGSAPALPGSRMVLPGGLVAYRTFAERVPSVHLLIDAASADVLPHSRVVAVDEVSLLPPSGELTVTASRSLGGVDVRVYTVTDSSTTLVAQGFARVDDGSMQRSAVEAEVASAVDRPAVALEIDEDDVRLWDPSSGESVEDRLRLIVSESMGYDVEDLPRELPLIDLGLDSLMGMRIKNRVEHDFQIPPLQVQALRDASVADVVRIVEEMVANRDTAEDNAEVAAGVATNDDAVSAADATSSADADAISSDDLASESQPAATRATGVGVAPRDASERLVFATWATVTGAAAAGVTSELPSITDEQAQRIADRLTERSGVEVSADDVLAAETLEPLANRVREGLETEVEGNIRVLRARPEGSTAPALFMFHPAGGSSVVYQPLMRRLPEEIPVYGVERLEGSFAERAAQYVDDVAAYAGDFPVIVGGWSFGGALAMEVAHQLKGTAHEPKMVVLLDTVRPSESVPDTPEETKARWERYSAFAKKTYGLDLPVPYELLETAGEDALLEMMGQFLATTDASEHGLSAGVLEHQRASFVDNRILDKVDFASWADVQLPVLLFRAERMHDGAIELEPRYAEIDEDGGWSAIVDQLDIVHLKGDHLAVVDEPEIAKVGAYLARRVNELFE